MAPYTPPTPYASLTGQVGYGNGLQLVDEVLSNLAKQWTPDGYLYDSIVAPVPVEYNVGRYPVFDPSTFFQTGGALEVADDAPTPIVDFNWSHDVYHCRDRRLQTRLTRKETLQAHPALRLEYSKTRGLLGVFANNRENRLATALRAQSNGGQFTNAVQTPVVKWDAGTASTPANIQGDLQAAALTAYKQTGRRPNTLVLDFEVAYAIGNDFTIKSLLQYLMGPRIVTDGYTSVLPPTLFGFKVLVADGTLYNQTRPGQTPSLTGTWGNSARLIYTDPAAAWGVPATVYSFRGRVQGGSAQAPDLIMPSGDGGQEPGPAGQWAIVDRYYDMDPPGEHIRAWECVDERVVAPELGVELGSVLGTF